MSSGNTTHWSVIRAASEGDAAARAEFARRYAPVIRAYLGARGRRTALFDELDDAAQEAFLLCLQEHGALERAVPGRPGGFRAYLFGVVRNVARRFEEGRGRLREGQAPTGAAERVAADDTHCSEAFDRAWAKAIVREALRRLTDRASAESADARRRVDILRLRFRDGLPVREIARGWNEDPTRIHREYARARREYEKTLREVVGEVHPDGGLPDLLDCLR